MSTPHYHEPHDELAQLEREHDELVASLPAHSVPAAMLLRIEALEDRIAELQAASAGDSGSSEED